MSRLEGKFVVVLGGATGIGAATVRRFVQEGAQVYLGDLNLEAAEALANSIGGGRVQARLADQGDADSVSELIDVAHRAFGALDCLFLNGAASSPALYSQDTDLVSIDMEIFRKIFEVNLYGYLHAARRAIPLMLDAGGGTIICTSSEASISTDGTVPAYVTSKSAVNGLVRHIAARYGSAGIRCNAILPGLILTEAMERVTTAEQRQHSLKSLASTRIGSPDDIAGMVMHLCSDDGVYINGQMISINGGSRM
ncbi:SDR family NAD(P)-dependent oxidoreductase [Pseudomonas sp.]|uniref:SDR family NAD(P)-dependent oxidoreductase n=1 Tax=Pseudomonas sp. TaxID=306 RepID=UPI003D103518